MRALSLSARVWPGEIQVYLSRGMYEERQVGAKYQRYFGPDNFFWNLQDHGIPAQRTVNQGTDAPEQEQEIPLVATNDMPLYICRRCQSHDILLCIQTGKKVTDEEPDAL